MKTTIDEKHENYMREVRNLGRYIATHRKMRDMTQHNLADLAGMDNTYLSRLEKGQIDKPRLTTLRKIAKALNINEDKLIVFVAPEKVPDAENVRPGARYDPNYTYVPDYLRELMAAERREDKSDSEEDADDREINELIEKTMIRVFRKLIKDGDLVKTCRGIIEQKVKKELISKAG